jgi:polar amino acid transport system substrate-binding protein
MRTRTALVASALAVALIGVAGCSSSGSPTSAPLGDAPRPAGVQDPAKIPPPASGAASASCGDATASLRPPASLPAPGNMPANTTMAKILARGRLIVGTDQNTYLFGFRNPETGAIEGFDVDIANEVAKAIFGTADGHVQLVAITSAQRIPYLTQGKVDIVAHTMTINCERWQQINFSTEYYHAGQKVLVPKASKANGIGDLGGKKVCAAAGSTSIVNIANAPSKPIPVSVNDWTDCLVMLQQGQVDAISTDDTILAGLAAQDPTVKLVTSQAFTNEPYGLGIAPKDDQFTRFVNGVLANIRSNGTWAAIYQRWLGGSGTPPAAHYKD